MRRVGVCVLLMVCIVSFLCPAVGKSNVIDVPQQLSCCSKMSMCKMELEQTSQHKRCGGEESQPRSCCSVSCTTLILFCPTSEGFTVPSFTGHAFATLNAIASARAERPPIPPPRV